MPIVKSYYKVLRVNPDPDYFYIQNEYAGNNTFTLTKNGIPNSTDLEYSKDKTTWIDITAGGTVAMAQGEKVYLRSTTGFSKNNSNDYRMTCNQNFSIGGKVATLFDYLNIDTFTAIPNYGLYSCFSSSGNTLISISNLDFQNITSVGENAVCNTFFGCRYITETPDLSGITSTSSSSFAYCFSTCYSLSLVKAPNVSSWTNSHFTDWLQGAGTNVPTGTSKNFYAPTGVTIPTNSNSGIPTGWTRVDY